MNKKRKSDDKCITCEEDTRIRKQWNEHPITCHECSRNQCHKCFVSRTCNGCMQDEQMYKHHICSECFVKWRPNVEMHMCISCGYGVASCHMIKGLADNRIYLCHKNCLDGLLGILSEYKKTIKE